MWSPTINAVRIVHKSRALRASTYSKFPVFETTTTYSWRVSLTTADTGPFEACCREFRSPPCTRTTQWTPCCIGKRDVICILYWKLWLRGILRWTVLTFDSDDRSFVRENPADTFLRLNPYVYSLRSHNCRFRRDPVFCV